MLCALLLTVLVVALMAAVKADTDGVLFAKLKAYIVNERKYNGEPLSYWIKTINTVDSRGRNRAGAALLGVLLDGPSEDLIVAENALLRCKVPEKLLGDLAPILEDDTSEWHVVVAAHLLMETSHCWLPTEEGREFVRSSLASPSVRRRLVLAEVLRGGGTECAATCVKSLTTLARDKNYLVRKACAQSLGKLGGQVDAAIPILSALTQDANSNVAAEAREALRGIEDAADGKVLLHARYFDLLKRRIPGINQASLSVRRGIARWDPNLEMSIDLDPDQVDRTRKGKMQREDDK
jgi:hypothetical protein